VLVLVGVHGLHYDEVAQICGCEVGTVKSRVCRARDQLKAILLSDGGARCGKGIKYSRRAQNIRSSAEATNIGTTPQRLP
jgi:hypothetical protein